jgi:hypothetical protein
MVELHESNEVNAQELKLFMEYATLVNDRATRFDELLNEYTIEPLTRVAVTVSYTSVHPPPSVVISTNARPGVDSEVGLSQYVPLVYPG